MSVEPLSGGLVDNGTEFIAKELQLWLAELKVKTIYITPASPWGSGFVELYHSSFRDECLNREQLWPPHQDPRCHRALPPALQSRAAAQLAQLAFSATLHRGKISSNPRRSHHITQAKD